MDINQLPTLRNNSKQTASNKWEYWEKKGRRRTVCSIGFFSYCVFDLNAKQRTVPVFFSFKKKTFIFFNPLLLSLPLCVVLKRPGSFFLSPSMRSCEVQEEFNSAFCRASLLLTLSIEGWGEQRLPLFLPFILPLPPFFILHLFTSMSPFLGFSQIYPLQMKFDNSRQAHMAMQLKLDGCRERDSVIELRVIYYSSAWRPEVWAVTHLTQNWGKLIVCGWWCVCRLLARVWASSEEDWCDSEWHPHHSP